MKLSRKNLASDKPKSFSGLFSVVICLKCREAAFSLNPQGNRNWELQGEKERVLCCRKWEKKLKTSKQQSVEEKYYVRIWSKRFFIWERDIVFRF